MSGLTWEGGKVQLKCRGLMQGAPSPHTSHADGTFTLEEQPPFRASQAASATSSRAALDEAQGLSHCRKGLPASQRLSQLYAQHVLLSLSSRGTSYAEHSSPSVCWETATSSDKPTEFRSGEDLGPKQVQE